LHCATAAFFVVFLVFSLTLSAAWVTPPLISAPACFASFLKSCVNEPLRGGRLGSSCACAQSGIAKKSAAANVSVLFMMFLLCRI